MSRQLCLCIGGPDASHRILQLRFYKKEAFRNIQQRDDWKSIICDALRDLVSLIQFKNLKNNYGRVLLLVYFQAEVHILQ